MHATPSITHHNERNKRSIIGIAETKCRGIGETSMVYKQRLEKKKLVYIEYLDELNGESTFADSSAADNDDLVGGHELFVIVSFLERLFFLLGRHLLDCLSLFVSLSNPLLHENIS